MKSIYNDESAQTGLIIFIIIGLFLMGIIYLLMSPTMAANNKMNNNLIQNSTLPYTQGRKDMMDSIYMYWWAFPLYMLVLFIIYGIKRAIDKQSGVI